MTNLDPTTLRDAYDAQLRTYGGAMTGMEVEWDGPLRRATALDGAGSGFIIYRDLGGLDGAELDALIERQRAHFAARGQEVEWKLHGHDRPADLADRLRAHGFEPGEQETVVIGPVAPLAAVLPTPPEGVRLREVSRRADLDRIAGMELAVWDADRTWIADGLEREIAADPAALTVVVAVDEATDTVVSAGWVRFHQGTAFATLWGGSTLPRWRRRGIYRALVVYRARLAAVRDYTLLQVDASDDSRPILERLGLRAVATTTPYVFRP